jgi:glucose-1-phosphate cytidylyltransferase
MKIVIFAGGKGTRIAEETATKPKPMIEIGGKPILWHIMKTYSHYGYNDFVICLGYKGYMIKEYFNNYQLHNSDVTYDFRINATLINSTNILEPWKVTLVNTGEDSNTAQRLKKIEKYIDTEDFMLTYGDGVCDINIQKLVDYHKEHRRLGTVTAVQPDGRFGALNLSESNQVLSFQEKPKGDNAWINGGFFVLSKHVFNHINENDITFEEGPLKKLSNLRELQAYKHHGFWHPMDTLRDKIYLDSCWERGAAPWKV